MCAFLFSNPSRKTNKDWSREIEVQEVFLDKLAAEKEEQEFGEQRIEVPLPETLMRVLYGVFLFAAVLFLAKSFELQVFASSKLERMAEQNALRNLPLPSNRGVIYDSSFKQLVFNRPSFDLVCDNRDLPPGPKEKERMLQELAGTLGIPFEELRQDFQSFLSARMLVAENLSHEQLVLLESTIEAFPGCRIQENTRREYVQGPLFSHIIGYTAKASPEEVRAGYSVIDQAGKTGVEKAQETMLRGTPGKIVHERDAFGRTMGELGRVPSQQGKSVVLWLNAAFQEKIVESLQRVFENTGTTEAAAIALDPNTGGVLALVSLPSFDNNLFAKGVSKQAWQELSQNPSTPLFNRAISGIGYPTGSVIKPLVGAAALEEDIIQENTTIFAPLELCVENRYTREDECFRDWEFHGLSDIKRAIAESVNTFFYIIGGGDDGFEGLGPRKIKEYVKRFGWGEKTGIDLPGEGKGILPTFDRNWRLGDTYHLSIGQGPFAVPPLQVASAFGAVANGGVLYEPRVVQRYVNEERDTIETLGPKAKRELAVSKETLEIIREGMRQTVTAGSASGWLDQLPVQAAAKTGTAQTGRKTPEGKDYLTSWTVAFAPLEDPEIVLVVLTEDIVEGQVGTLPVVRDALQWYFNR